MKHFEINYYHNGITFVYKCTTAYEALEAVRAMGVPLDEMDAYMDILITFKKGQYITHSHSNFSIRYIDGEV